MNLESINRGPEVGLGNANSSGTGLHFYMAEWRNNMGITYDPLATDFEDLATLDFADLTGFSAGDLVRIDHVQHMGEVRDNQIGEEGGREFQHEFEFMLAKNTAQHLGFLGATANSRLVFFIPTMDGQFRVVGNDKWPAVRTTGSAKTNKKPGDTPAAGQMNTWESFGPCPAKVLVATEAQLQTLL